MKKKRRSAIVPAFILSTAVAASVAVVPLLAACSDSGPEFTVAVSGFGVADQGFVRDMSVTLTVAAEGFDLSTDG